MPLAHRSLSHGTVVFGFFNIDTDCLLLNNVFFFATDFCAWIKRWAAEGPTTRTGSRVRHFRTGRRR